MMSRAKCDRILAGQTACARKVYDAIPIQTAWPRHFIQQEITRRQGAMRPDLLDGCLYALKEAHLIVGQHGDKWQRAPVREPAVGLALAEAHEIFATGKVVTTRENDIVSSAMPVVPKADPEPDFLVACERVASKLRVLADEVEALGLRHETESQDMKQRLVKYDQLRELLK